MISSEDVNIVMGLRLVLTFHSTLSWFYSYFDAVSGFWLYTISQGTPDASFLFL